MNIVAALVLVIGLGLIAGDICTSLDCSAGNKAACEIVAKRYEAR